jgi:hypothetical protein
MHPFLILLVGMVVILGAIIVLRLNAFLALLRSWTPLLAVVGVVSLLTTLLMATVLPLR